MRLRQTRGLLTTKFPQKRGPRAGVGGGYIRDIPEIYLRHIWGALCCGSVLWFCGRDDAHDGDDDDEIEKRRREE